MKLASIARHLDCELVGDGEIEILGAAGIGEAGPEDITFLSNPKYVREAKRCKAGAIIVAPTAPALDMPRLISENPYLSFARSIQLFYTPPETCPGIHPTATIAETARLGEGYSIGAGVVIGEGAVLGDRAVLHPNVIIYPYAHIGDDFVAHSHAVVREYCRIGHRVTLQNGAIIGADGFGFAPRGDGSYEKIVQAGIVVLEDDVEIGSYTCIDRATVGETRIGASTKIDNLVQIGHGCRVGSNTVLAAQAGLAGSTRVGDRVMLGGQVGAAGHLTIGDDVVATARTGIARSVEAGSHISGSPEMETRLWQRNYFYTLRLPDLVRTIRSLRARVEQLERAREHDDEKVD